MASSTEDDGAGPPDGDQLPRTDLWQQTLQVISPNKSHFNANLGSRSCEHDYGRCAETDATAETFAAN